jgi:hypothetical protein
MRNDATLSGWWVFGIFTQGSSFLANPGLELLKNPPQKRTMVATLFFFAATALCFSSGHHFVIEWGQ